MIPSNIERQHVIKALQEIDSNGIPPGRVSRKFLLLFDRKQYPPKYVLSLANKFANGELLHFSSFSGGQETNSFLKVLGFSIVRKSFPRTIVKQRSHRKEIFTATEKEHDERCLACKNTIERMLAKISSDR